MVSGMIAQPNGLTATVLLAFISRPFAPPPSSPYAHPTSCLHQECQWRPPPHDASSQLLLSPRMSVVHSTHDASSKLCPHLGCQ